MNKLSTFITSPDQATRAASWCKRHKIAYDLEYWGWPGQTKYKFIFEKDADLVMFSLKWT